MSTIRKAIKQEEKVIGDLKRTFVHRDPSRQKHVKASAAEASGNIALGYYRGLSGGRIEGHTEAYRAIKRKDPKLAKWLYDELGLKDEQIRR